MQYPLPIFDHIRDKTLILVDYKLSMGVCVGLAKAFSNEQDLVHSFIFENCGITDEMLAILLGGMLRLTRVRSLIYRRNEFGEMSASLMERILKRFMPQNIEELRIERCEVTKKGLGILL
jgi:hypothetical protein